MFYGLDLMDKDTKRSTAIRMMTVAYIRLFVFIFILITFVVVTTVSYKLVKSRVSDADRIIASLNKSDIDSGFDWSHWKKNSTIDTNNTFVVVKRDGNSFYSAGTKAFLSKAKHETVVFGISKVEDGSFYFYRTKKYRHIQYAVYLGLNEVFNTTKTLLVSLLLILAIIFAGSLWFIIKLARKLSMPLHNLSLAVENLNIQNDIDSQVPNVNEPAEVYILSETLKTWLTNLQKQNNREKEFFVNASHELKTPLAGFQGNLDLITRRGKLHPEIVQPALNALDKESKRMQRLVNYLLEIARNENGITEKKTTFSAQNIVNKVTCDFQEDSKAKVQIRVKKDFNIFGSYDELQQVLRIILDNAKKYSSNASEILIVIEDGNIAIIDQGQGISEEDKPHVFDRFYRGEKTRSNVQGNGLGLSLALQFANKNNASLSVSDDIPKGTIITVSFTAK